MKYDTRKPVPVPSEDVALADLIVKTSAAIRELVEIHSALEAEARRRAIIKETTDAD